MNPAEELVCIVDDRNQVVGSLPRWVMRRNRCPHRAAYILVFNSKGELFVHKRTKSKDVYPGFYDVAAGGVVLAGESYEAAAVRELAEELGISGITLQRLFDFCHEDSYGKVWGVAFACVYDGPLRLQAEEIEGGEFIEVAEVQRRAARENFTPDGLRVLERYLDEGGGP